MGKSKKSGKKGTLANIISSALAKYKYLYSENSVDHIDFDIPTGCDEIDDIIANNDNFVVVNVITPNIIGGYVITIFQSTQFGDGEYIMPKISSILKEATLVGLFSNNGAYPYVINENYFETIRRVIKDGGRVHYSTPIGNLIVIYIRPVDIMDNTLDEVRGHITETVYQAVDDSYKLDDDDKIDATIILPHVKNFNWDKAINLYRHCIIWGEQMDEYREMFIPMMMTDYMYSDIIGPIYRTMITRLFNWGAEPVPRTFKQQYKYLEKIIRRRKLSSFDSTDVGAFPPASLKEYLKKHGTKLIAEGLLNPHYLEIDNNGLFTS